MHLTPTQRTGLIAGGAIVVGGITAFIAKSALAKAAPAAAPSNTPSNTPVLPVGPPAPGPTPGQVSQVFLDYTPVSQLTPGASYLFASTAGSYTTSASLLAALQAAGWTNATVAYFGPEGDTSAQWPGEMPWPADPTTMPTMYVAGGAYSGSTPYVLPAGTVAYQVGPAVALPATPTVVPTTTGQNILVVNTGQLYIGNTTCKSKPVMTMLGNSTALAQGATQAEVVSKLTAWLLANCS